MSILHYLKDFDIENVKLIWKWKTFSKMWNWYENEKEKKCKFYIVWKILILKM